MKWKRNPEIPDKMDELRTLYDFQHMLKIVHALALCPSHLAAHRIRAGYRGGKIACG
jgi:hypothetical protein